MTAHTEAAEAAISRLMEAGLSRAEATLEYVNSLHGETITEDQVEAYEERQALLHKPNGTEHAAGAAPLEGEAQFPNEWLTDQPPPVEWLIDHWMPAGKVGLIIGEGGVGKSTFLIALMASIATGVPILGLTPKARQRVLYMSLEDDEDTVRRRLYWVANRITGQLISLHEYGLGPSDFNELLHDNLRIKFGAGYTCHLIRSEYQDVKQTEMVATLSDYAHSIGGVGLIAFDTVSRIHGLNENDNAVGAAGIAAFEAITRLSGAGLIALHHTGKDSARNRTEDQYAGRGASSWADNARYVMRLIAASEDECACLSGITAESISRKEVLKLSMAKLNAAQKPDPIFMQRHNSDIQPLRAATGAIATLNADTSMRDALITYGRDNNQELFSANDLESLSARIWPMRKPSRVKVREFVAVAKQHGWLKEIPGAGRGGARLKL